MDEKKLKTFEIITLLIYSIGPVWGLQMKIGMINDFVYYITGECELLYFFYRYVVTIYLGTLLVIPVAYLILGCIFYKRNDVKMNIIDSVLCVCSTFVFPVPISILIYFVCPFLYYLLGCFFVFLPLICCEVEKKIIDSFHILKIITRILMIVTTVIFILSLESCRNGIVG